jgi:ABC-type multidrug transport system ATPase subunit
MDEAEYCHRVLIMQNGEAIANGKPNELQAQYQVPNMQALFLKLVS